MKIRVLFLLGLLAVSVSKLSAQGVQINMTSPGGEIGKLSTGALLPATFTFSLGSFGSFVPTSINLSDWASNFTVVPTAGSANWDADFGVSIGSTLPSNAGVFATTNKAYLWGYNSQTIVPGVTEWVLFANNSWSFPVSTSPDPVFWDVNDNGTVAIFGTLAALGANPYIQTALVAAIPEPSTYAALFGAAAVAMVWVRRRCQAVA